MNLQLIQFISCFSNAQQTANPFFFFPFSKRILDILKILKKEGYINYFKLFKIKDKKYFKIVLKNFVTQKQSVYVKGLFKPSLPKIFSKKDLWTFSSKTGLVILSTPVGILSSREAILTGVGGNVLFFIC